MNYDFNLQRIVQTLKHEDIKQTFETFSAVREGNRTFRQKKFETFRQKKVRDVSANFSCRNVPYYLVFGFLQTG